MSMQFDPQNYQDRPLITQTCDLKILLMIKVHIFVLKSINIQTLFHPLTRVFFNFPSKYLFSIGVPKIFSFGSIYTPIFTLESHPALLFSKFPTNHTLRRKACVKDGWWAFHPNCYYSKTKHRSYLFVETKLTIPLPLLKMDSSLNIALFIRHYYGHLIWFLFFRLVRCFNSADSQTKVRAPTNLFTPLKKV